MGSLWDWLNSSWFAEGAFWRTVAIIVIFPAVCLEIQRFIQFRFRQFDLRIFSANDNSDRHLNNDLIPIKDNVLIIEILNRSRANSIIKSSGILFDNKKRLKFNDQREFELKGWDSIQIPFDRNKVISLAEKYESTYIRAYIINNEGRKYRSKKFSVKNV